MTSKLGNLTPRLSNQIYTLIGPADQIRAHSVQDTADRTAESIYIGSI